MKRYRPSNKTVMIGITLMVIGIVCWCIKAMTATNPQTIFLFPVGLLLICIGGLELTITAFMTVYKNDLAMRAKSKEEADKQESDQR